MTSTGQPGRDYRQRTVGIAVAAGLVSVLVIWYWVGAEQTDRVQTVVRDSLTRVAETRHIVWQEQDRFAYELSLNGIVTFDPDNKDAESMAYSLDGLLCMRVLEAGNGKPQIGMQLRDLVREHQGVSDPRLIGAMSLPFVVQFEGGMPSMFQFPRGLSVDVQDELSELIRGFQVKLPDQPSRQWSTIEENRDGRYRASYQIDSRGVWNKTKLSYVSVGEVTDDFNIDKILVTNSLATFVPAKNNGWWQGIEIAEELEFLVSRQPLIKVKKRAKLVSVVDGCYPGSDLANISKADDLHGIIVSNDYTDDKPVVKEVRVAGTEDRKRFNRLTLAFIESKAKNLNDVHAIADMLETFPELSAEIPSLLMQDDIAEMAEAGLIHALELAGNEAAQKVLRDLAANSFYQYPNQLRSIISLSGVENPAPESIETLWQMSLDRAGPEGENLANTALLALGSMSKQLREAGDDRYYELSSRLGADLAGQDSETKVIFLTAMSNSKDPGLLPYATQELEALEPMVRTAAIEAVTSVDTPESFHLIYSRLSHEDNNRVRKALIEGMSRHSHKDESAFKSLVQMLESEENKEVRRSMAMYLAENIDTYPLGRNALEKFLNDTRNSANSRADVSSKMRANAGIPNTGRPRP